MFLLGIVLLILGLALHKGWLTILGGLLAFAGFVVDVIHLAFHTLALIF